MDELIYIQVYSLGSFFFSVPPVKSCAREALAFSKRGKFRIYRLCVVDGSSPDVLPVSAVFSG